MRQTWLNRKINGPRQVGEGVKPYVAKDDADYAKRTQMYNDSLAAHNATENIINTLRTPNMIVDDNPYTDHNYYTNVEGSTGDLNSKPYESYSGVKGVAQDIKTLKRTDKSLGNKDTVKSKIYYDGGGVGRSRHRYSTFELPYRPKPKQPIESNRSDMAKMPTKKAALSSSQNNSTVKSRAPKYSMPYKSTSGSDKNYATINRSDGTGNKNLSKNEYNAEMRLFKNKK